MAKQKKEDTDRIYFQKFANFSTAAKTEVLRRVLLNFQKTEAEADHLLSCIVTEIQREEMLLRYIHNKRGITDEEGREIDKLEILRVEKYKNKRGETEKHRKIRLNLPIIKDLRNRKWSWVEISKYLKKTRKLQISYVHLKKIYGELYEKFYGKN